MKKTQTPRLFVRKPRNKYALGRRVQPAAVIKLKEFWIKGDFKTVKNSGHFAGLFSKGDHVLELHFHALDGRIMLSLLEKLRNSFPKLKKSEISGVYTDTPNQAIANYFIRKGAIEVATPSSNAMTAGIAYRTQKDYPAKYRNEKVRRVIIKF